MGKVQRRMECVFYMETYLPVRYLVAFYAQRRELKLAVQVFHQHSEELTTADVFLSNLFKIVAEDGDSVAVEQLLHLMQAKDSSMHFWRKYLSPVGMCATSGFSPNVMYLVHMCLKVSCCSFCATGGLDECACRTT